MTEVAQIVGSVVAQIAWDMLRPVAGAPRPALRAANFSQDEILSLVAAIQQIKRERGERGDYGLTVKIGTVGPIDGIPENFLLGPGETLTKWRNAQVPALLLVDWDVQGDEEGLAAVSRLDDMSILGTQDEDVLELRQKLLIEIAWKAAGQTGAPLPVFVQGITAIREFLPPYSIRRWTSFVAACCEGAAILPLKSPDALHEAIGNCLDHLGLFPDPSVLSADSPVRTRLTRNLYVSDLRLPAGLQISDDDLLALIDGTDFAASSLARLALSDPQLRGTMRSYVLGQREESRPRLDLEVWLELHSKASDPVGLGHLVREAIEREDDSRVAEFDDLGVEAGLDDSEQIAAEKFIRSEPIGDQRPLVDLTGTRLRRRVEKLAFPDAQLEGDPLKALLHSLHLLDEGGQGEARLGVDAVPDEGRWSRWLFALMYGQTLKLLQEASSEERWNFQVDPRLTDLSRPAMPLSDDDFDIPREWAPLRLTVAMSNGGKRRFRWNPQLMPGHVAFAALLVVPCIPPAAPIDTSLEDFFNLMLNPRNWNDFNNDDVSSEFAERMRQLHELHAAKWLEVGITADGVDDYVTEWAGVLEEARVTLVPTHAPNADLEALVLSQIGQLSSDRLIMFATHPLRLRWLVRHLRRMSRYLLHALSDGLDLNAENSDLFFEWLDRASPHGTPPFIVGPNETVAVSARESGWHEEFVPISRSGNERRDWLGAVDDAAVDELVKVVETYLDTYPYKMDGISLLLLDRDGSSRLPLRIATRLRTRRPGVRLLMHVLVDSSQHHAIVRAFDAEFADLELGEEALLPDVQLMLRHWDPEGEPNLRGLEESIDIALAPAVFGTSTKLHAHTRDENAGISGAYDPWIHASSHNLADASQNVVRAMLPSQKDPLLETWSTLCVRAETHSVVAPHQESNTDYFQLTVQFNRHQELFVELHQVAHWVATLDAFVGRDQIDALDSKPDVILVRPGVGKNEAYTLLVSSSTGRKFVVHRLVRKLRNDLGFTDGDHDISATANRIYDVGTNVVPGAVLRALGLGRAANEVLGLVASRFIVASRAPVRGDKPGLVVWISFDEQQSWFGRTTRTRADLGRFALIFDESSGDVELEILVVESKYRRSFDVGGAEQQLDRTTVLMRDAFSREGNADDQDFWLQELASAIEQTSSIVASSSDLPARQLVGPERSSLEEAVLQCIRAGRLRLTSVRGVAVAIASADASVAPVEASLGGHELIRLNKPELTALIKDLVDCVDPTQAGRADNNTTMTARVPASASSSGPIANNASTVTGVKSEEVPVLSRNGEPVAGLDASLVGEGPAVGAEGRGLSEDDLRARYERLLSLLASHRVSVATPPSGAWQEGPGFYVLRVVPKTGVTVDRVVNRVDEIALELRLPAGSEIRTSLDRGCIVFEIPKAPEERYPVMASQLWNTRALVSDRLVVPIGADIAGMPVELEFSSPDSPHLLVAGTTGSGKSVALETILRGLCRYESDRVRLWLVDPKGTELIDFEDDPHTEGAIGFDAADAILMLERAVSEMQRRYSLMRPARARSIAEYNTSVAAEEQLPWIVLVLDEYADLTSDSDDKSAIESLLRRLTQKARAAGIHVIAATQRPSADVVSTTIRANFPAQLALRVKTATDSRIIMDESGAEALAGQGDAFLKTARGVQRLQVAWSGQG